MKFLLVCTLILLGTTTHAQVSRRLVCKRSDILAAAQIAKEHAPNSDKNIHCTVSCMLTMKCSPASVMTLGVLKELQDVFGPGNAEWKDLEADRLGIELVTSKRAGNNRECLEQCDLYYRP